MTYTRDDVTHLLPSVCWVHHLHPGPHECIRDESYWTSPPRPEPKSSIDPAKYRIIDWPTHAEIDQMEPRLRKQWRDRIELAAYPDDRKAYIDPKKSNTVWAELIDIQTSWVKADLTLKERQALYLRYGLEFTEAQIGANQNCSQQMVSRRISRAVEKLTNHLNFGVTESLLDFLEEL